MNLPSKVGLEGLCMAGVSALVLFAACATEEPTAVSTRPSHVVRGAGCSPLVIETSSDDADTTLITFEDPSGGLASCNNLVPWGVDYKDPIGVDTPQGNGDFVARSDASNMPSPPMYAMGAWYTPPQVVIEFDPPIYSAEFYYSRIANSPAMVNGQPGSSDGVWVYAMSRTPGTLFYQTYDTKLLPSTQPLTSPASFSVWAQTRLAATSDKIQWLWFDGAIGIDNLKIVRHPLICTSPVTRGQQVSCKVSSPSWTVTGWEFNPDNTGSLTVGPVQEASASTEWKGTAVATGVVTAHVTNGGASRDLKARFVVNTRQSPWGTAGNWTYYDSISPSMDVEPIPGVQITYGRNCPDSLPCVRTSHVQPDPAQFPGFGFTADTVASGPNKGYWYVATSKYAMHRHAKLNPAIYDTSHWTHPVANPTNQCRNALGFGPKAAVSANWNRYSNKCKGINTPGFVSAVLGHEGFGYGGGVGHEGLARATAGDGAHDPHRAIDPLVYPDAATLDGAVTVLLSPIANEIDERSDDSTNTAPGYPAPHGNYPGGTVWQWVNSAFAAVTHPPM